MPAYEGGKFPLSTYLADRVRAIVSDPREWGPLPDQVREWLEIQKWRSQMPGRRELLVETFPRANKYYLVCYPFEGRLAHQTLGMLLTRRLERARLRPMGFVANEYALAVWGLGDVALRIQRGELSLAELFDQDMLGDDLEAWLAESALMKRTFRTCAIIAGLIERRFPGQEKSRRQVTISTDLVYDVLRGHQPDHVLLRAARADAATGLLDIKRLGEMLSRIRGRIVHKASRPRLAACGSGDAGDRPRGSLRRGGRFVARRGGGRTGEGGDAVRAGVSPAHSRESGNRRRRWVPAFAATSGAHCSLSPASRSSPIAPARSIGPMKSCSSSPICISKKARPSPSAACCCRLTTRQQRSRGSRASSSITRPASWWRSATVSTTAADLRASPTADRAALAALQRGRDWIWIAGNHDPDPADGIGGRFAEVLAFGPLTLRHEPSAQANDGEIAGHLHPLARVARRGRAVSRRCFASDGRRLVMPAFGAYTGGLNVRDRAIAALFGSLAFTAHMLGDSRLYAIAAARCLSD